MSEEGEIRSFSITGEAAKAYSGGVKKRRVTRKKGGEEEMNSTNVPTIHLPNIQAPAHTPVHTPVHTPSPISNTNQNIPSPAPAVIHRQNAPVETPRPPIQEGGDDKKIKVELKKKQGTKKVQLHPKKEGVQKVLVPKKTETRKKNRKVLLGVSSLHKRMTRAKKMHKKVTEMPIHTLRDELISKKLIKPTSKAPESILRQIATDAKIVESKSL